jgi:hypothetical protein
MSLCLPQSHPGPYVAAIVNDEFKALLNKIAIRFPSRQAFANAIGMNGSRLSRALNTGDFPFNVTNCLRLAKLSGESPAEILRAAGKADVADLIESLYGKDRTRLLSLGERELLDEWEGLTPPARDALRVLMRERQISSTKEPKHSRRRPRDQAADLGEARAPITARRRTGK